MNYKDAGVDIEKGHDVSMIMSHASKVIQGRDIIRPRGGFCSAIRVGNLLVAATSDGIGTKVEVAERLEKYDTLGHDLVAMLVDDLVCHGFEPAVVLNTIDWNRMEPGIAKQLSKGLGEAVDYASVALGGGECAELGYMVQGYGESPILWSGTAIGFMNPDRKSKGVIPNPNKDISVTNAIVALRSNGFRSNGYSLCRRILELSFGERWHKQESLAKQLLEPSVIYSRCMLNMLGKMDEHERADIRGIVHVTGGGVPGNLSRILKRGQGARLYDLFEPHEAMIDLQKLGGVADYEAYRTWNMGQGMLVVTPKPEDIIEVADEYGIGAKICGEIIEADCISIKSKGLNKGELEYRLR
ncbi:phosphoribosylformylglycinamidine cyclo-ligase [Candidatus Woesearchaeota archaeon]|nr:phosphoribosylformylglycinamidine cyclo-ligase [Candidatus Woesearchaeota archaeon]